MKKMYSQPRIVEFGDVQTLTLGANGSLPDYDTSGGLVNSDCLPDGTFEVNGVKYERIACVETLANS